MYFAKVQGGISIENPVIVGPKFLMPRLKDTIPGIHFMS